MGKPTIGGRVPEPLKQEFDEYRDKRNLSQTDALRELLRAGLEAKANSQTDANTDTGGGKSILERLANFRTVAVGVALQVLTVALWAGAISVSSTSLPQSLVLVAIGTVTVTLAVVVIAAAALAQLALARPLRGLVPGFEEVGA